VTEPVSGRIVVDAEELRRLASRLSEAAAECAATARTLATTAFPPMPVAVSELVVEGVTQAAEGLHRLANEMLQDSGDLYIRAAAAETGEARSAARQPWEYYGSGPEPHEASSHRWAGDLLDRMGPQDEVVAGEQLDPAALASVVSDQSEATGSLEPLVVEWMGPGLPLARASAPTIRGDSGVGHLLSIAPDHPGLGLIACLRTGGMGGDDQS
jgi:hypothetical protein